MGIRAPAARATAAIMLLCGADALLACTPAPGWRPASVEYKAKAADVVILGQAINHAPQGKVVEVARWLKGSGPRYVLVSGFGNSAACLSDVPLKHQAVFFGKLDPATGVVFLNYTGIHDAIEESAAAAAVTKAVGSPPAVPIAEPVKPGR